MEDRKGLLSHSSGVIRIIIFVILIAVIVFFAVRFMKNRQNANHVNQATQTAQNKEDDTARSTSSGAEDKKSEQVGDRSNQNKPEQSQVPSGVADTNQVPGTGPQTIPETGSSLDILIMAGILSVATYIVGWKHSRTNTTL